MSQDLQSLTTLVDREAIRDVLSRYGDHVDALEIEEVGALMTEDVVAVLMGREIQGRQALIRFLTKALGGFSATSHHIGNNLITIDGDRATQTATLYAFHRHADGGAVWHFYGRYEQDLRRTDYGWLVSRHVLHPIDSLPDGPGDTSPTGHPRRTAIR